MKIRLAGTELFHMDWQMNRWTADRQTDMKKLTVTFRIFTNAPKIRSQERGVYMRSADGFIGVE
jgi:hypothetical protein